MAASAVRDTCSDNFLKWQKYINIDDDVSTSTRTCCSWHLAPFHVHTCTHVYTHSHLNTCQGIYVGHLPKSIRLHCIYILFSAIDPQKKQEFNIRNHYYVFTTNSIMCMRPINLCYMKIQQLNHTEILTLFGRTLCLYRHTATHRHTDRRGEKETDYIKVKTRPRFV